MKTLGTILPTAASLAVEDRLHAEWERASAELATRVLTGCEARLMGGEMRYYDAREDHYAVISRRLAVHWFLVRADGDYAIQSPKKH